MDFLTNPHMTNLFRFKIKELPIADFQVQNIEMPVFEKGKWSDLKVKYLLLKDDNLPQMFYEHTKKNWWQKQKRLNATLEDVDAFGNKIAGWNFANAKVKKIVLPKYSYKSSRLSTVEVVFSDFDLNMDDNV